MKTISSTFGKNIKITIYGGSHEPEIGVRLEKMPPGFNVSNVDMARLEAFLARRAPGNSPLATARKESDTPVLTKDNPVTFVIYNQDQRSRDYAKMADTPRPGHADYTAAIRYKGEVSMSGGGPFSGRMTAPLCIAGGIALQILEKKDITISAHLAEAGGVRASANEAETNAMTERILAAKREGDSVGGRVRCLVSGMPAGIGGAMYDGLESLLAPIIFGIPGVKGLSFGEGFAACSMTGSEHNDPFEMTAPTLSSVRPVTNHAGGILGGISTGADIIMDVAFKPTASIAKEQNTVNLKEGTNTTMRVGGRHDPCIAVRAVPVVEAAMALGLLDAFAGQEE